MNRETILIVDDNKEIVYSLGKLLRFEGYEIVEAFDGMEALACSGREEEPRSGGHSASVPAPAVSLVRPQRRSLCPGKNPDSVSAPDCPDLRRHFGGPLARKASLRAFPSGGLSPAAFAVSVAVFDLLLTAVLFLAGLQMFFLYILGAYLSKDYLENKKRPIYIVKERG